MGNNSDNETVDYRTGTEWGVESPGQFVDSTSDSLFIVPSNTLLYIQLLMFECMAET